MQLHSSTIATLRQDVWHNGQQCTGQEELTQWLNEIM